jgi:hypothetical protein
MPVTIRGSGQVPVQIITATTSTSVSVAGTANYADTTLTATITPSSSSNRILVLVYQPWITTGASDSYGGFRVLRDATIIFNGVGDNIGPFMIGKTAAGALYGSFSLNLLDAPNTTSAVTYKTMIRNYSTGTFTTNPSASPDASTSYITLMELAYA